MKNVFLFLWVALATAIAPQAQAQKTLTEGTITYEMKIENNPQAAMMGEIKMDLAFLGSQSYMGMNLMNGMINTRIIMDNAEDNKNTVMLMSMMGKNIAVQMAGDEMEKYAEKQRKNQEPPKITYYKKETKKIAGYKCYKAIAEIAGAGEVTLYICDKIKPAGTSQFQMQFPGMEGYPLSIEMKQQGMEILFITTKVDTKKPAEKLFDKTIPEGYDVMTMEDLEKQGGGGGMFGM